MLAKGTITLLFTDLESSTDLLQRLGETEARKLWRVYFRLLRDAARTRGGKEVKSLGDGLMVVFPSAREAVLCAVDIQREISRHNRRSDESHRLQVRVGLHIGEPIQDEEDYFGTPVVIARRLSDCAQGGQILVSEIVRDIIGRVEGVEFVDRGLCQLKGFSDQWRLHEVLWRGEETPAAFALATISERTPFVGRENEWAKLRRLLEQQAGGSGSVVMIEGEPGVGKTRITDELITEAGERGMLALVGHCHEMEGALPYAPFAEILKSLSRTVKLEPLLNALGDSASELIRLMPELRRIFPDIPEPRELPPEHGRALLFNCFRELIRLASDRPLVIILEDLQWADEPTLLLLHHIAQSAGEMTVLIAGTYRQMNLETNHPLSGIIERLLRQRIGQKWILNRFTKGGVKSMLTARGGHEPPASLVNFLFVVTEGNPFFVEEIFRHLFEHGKLFDVKGDWRADLSLEELEVPESVRLIINRRLERVSEQCRRALTEVAVIGRSFGFELFRELVGLDEGALLDVIDAAERTQLISSTTDAGEAVFTFSHELIRQTLIADLSLPRRQRYHLRVAEAMERIYDDASAEHASEIAHHLYQARAAAAPEKTVHYLELAAKRALSAAALEDALLLYEKALSLQSANDIRTRAGLLYKRGLTLRSLRRWQEALPDWREALAIYEKLGDTEEASRLNAEISGQLLEGARVEESRETAPRGFASTGHDVPKSPSS